MDDYPRVQGDDRIYMAAGQGAGLAMLAELISGKLFGSYRQTTFLIPYEQGQIMSYLMEHTLSCKTEYMEQGIRVTALCSREDCDRYEKYRVTG